jgi:serine/threonine-protein kinase
MRYLNGAFVIIAKTSIYNSDPATYDARHNEMTGEQFRQYIERNIKLIDEETNRAAHKF